MLPIALAFIAGALLTTGCLWAIAVWSGAPVPVVDLVIFCTLCSGLALLPRAGLVLAMLIMTLLLVRTTDVDPWPYIVVMLVASAAIWIVVDTLLLALLRGRPGRAHGPAARRSARRRLAATTHTTSATPTAVSTYQTGQPPWV
jgi:hypothetical protein